MRLIRSTFSGLECRCRIKYYKFSIDLAAIIAFSLSFYMTQVKSNRMTFLKGLGCAAVAILFISQKKRLAKTDTSGLQSESLRLPLVARKAPRAVARENRFV